MDPLSLRTLTDRSIQENKLHAERDLDSKVDSAVSKIRRTVDNISVKEFESTAREGRSKIYLEPETDCSTVTKVVERLGDYKGFEYSETRKRGVSDQYGPGIESCNVAMNW